MRCQFRAQNFTQWLLDLIDLTVNVIGKERKDEGILLLDHLVDSGILSTLVNVLCSQHLCSLEQNFSWMLLPPEVPQQDVVKRLRMIIGFDQKYESQLRRSPLLTLLQSIFEEDRESESDSKNEENE
jgi:hypothetical protein